jgi:hypothetical protein
VAAPASVPQPAEAGQDELRRFRTDVYDCLTARTRCSNCSTGCAHQYRWDHPEKIRLSRHECGSNLRCRCRESLYFQDDLV